MFKLRFINDLEACRFRPIKGTEIVIGVYPKHILGLGVKICSTAKKPIKGEFQDYNTGTRLYGWYLDRKIRVYTFRKSAGKWSKIFNKFDLRVPAYEIDKTIPSEGRKEARIRKRYE